MQSSIKQFFYIYTLVLKCTHGPVTTFWTCAAAVKFIMTLFFYFFKLKYLMHLPCSFVNKVWDYEICRQCFFVFYILHKVLFGIEVVIIQEVSCMSYHYI